MALTQTVEVYRGAQQAGASEVAEGFAEPTQVSPYIEFIPISTGQPDALPSFDRIVAVGMLSVETNVTSPQYAAHLQPHSAARPGYEDAAPEIGAAFLKAAETIQPPPSEGIITKVAKRVLAAVNRPATIYDEAGVPTPVDQQLGGLIVWTNGERYDSGAILTWYMQSTTKRVIDGISQAVIGVAFATHDERVAYQRLSEADRLDADRRKQETQEIGERIPRQAEARQTFDRNVALAALAIGLSDRIAFEAEPSHSLV